MLIKLYNNIENGNRAPVQFPIQQNVFFFSFGQYQYRPFLPIHTILVNSRFCRQRDTKKNLATTGKKGVLSSSSSLKADRSQGAAENVYVPTFGSCVPFVLGRNGGGRPDISPSSSTALYSTTTICESVQARIVL